MIHTYAKLSLCLAYKCHVLHTMQIGTDRVKCKHSSPLLFISLFPLLMRLMLFCCWRSPSHEPRCTWVAAGASYLEHMLCAHLAVNPIGCRAANAKSDAPDRYALRANNHNFHLARIRAATFLRRPCNAA